MRKIKDDTRIPLTLTDVEREQSLIFTKLR